MSLKGLYHSTLSCLQLVHVDPYIHQTFVFSEDLDVVNLHDGGTDLGCPPPPGNNAACRFAPGSSLSLFRHR